MSDETELERYIEWSTYYERCEQVHAKPLTYSEYCDRWGWWAV